MGAGLQPLNWTTVVADVKSDDSCYLGFAFSVEISLKPLTVLGDMTAQILCLPQKYGFKKWQIV